MPKNVWNSIPAYSVKPMIYPAAIRQPSHPIPPPLPPRGKTYMMWILPKVPLSNRDIPGNEGNGGAQQTRNLEADVPPHGEARPGAARQEPRANDGGGCEEQERKGAKEGVHQDQPVVARVAMVPCALAFLQQQTVSQGR